MVAFSKLFQKLPFYIQSKFQFKCENWLLQFLTLDLNGSLNIFRNKGRGWIVELWNYFFAQACLIFKPGVFQINGLKLVTLLQKDSRWHGSETVSLRSRVRIQFYSVVTAQSSGTAQWLELLTSVSQITSLGRVRDSNGLVFIKFCSSQPKAIKLALFTLAGLLIFSFNNSVVLKTPG